MKPAEALQKVEGILTKRPEVIGRVSERPTILVATIDPEIHRGLTELFKPFSLNTIWFKGVEAAKAALAREKKVVACLCGFWLQDGTYRELVRHIRREKLDIPVVIVSSPACPDEYRDFLAAIKLGAIDFLSYPYSSSDLHRMSWMAVQPETPLQTTLITSDLCAGEAA